MKFQAEERARERMVDNEIGEEIGEPDHFRPLGTIVRAVTLI